MAVGASVITGAISAIATVKALNVHIEYIRENVTRVENIATRAHSRIDELIEGG
jgi:hypothetical protein